MHERLPVMSSRKFVAVVETYSLIVSDLPTDLRAPINNSRAIYCLLLKSFVLGHLAVSFPLTLLADFLLHCSNFLTKRNFMSGHSQLDFPQRKFRGRLSMTPNRFLFSVFQVKKKLTQHVRFCTSV